MRNQKENEDKSKNWKNKKEDITGVWIGFVSTSLIFLLLGIFVVGLEWWVFFVPAMVLVGAISSTIEYYTKYLQKCPICGLKLKPDAEFCTNCGTKLKKVCPSCGNAIENLSGKFCEKCGASLYEAEVAAKGASSANTLVDLGLNENIVATVGSAKTKVEISDRIRYCPSCGNKVKIGTHFCPYCGMDLK